MSGRRPRSEGGALASIETPDATPLYPLAAVKQAIFASDPLRQLLCFRPIRLGALTPSLADFVSSSRFPFRPLLEQVVAQDDVRIDIDDSLNVRLAVRALVDGSSFRLMIGGAVSTLSDAS